MLDVSFLAFGFAFAFAFVFVFVFTERRGCESIANKRAFGRHTEVVLVVGVAVARGRLSWRRFLCMRWNRRRHQHKRRN
jgi:hypothetical protein